MAENKITMEKLNERMRMAPFNTWLGLELVEMDEERVRVRIPWRQEFLVSTKGGYAHGGILASIIDTVADVALAAKLGAPIPTVDLRVDYHRAAKEGDMMCEGRVIKLGRTLSTAEAYVYDSDGKLLASGRGVYNSPPVKEIEA